MESKVHVSNNIGGKFCCERNKKRIHKNLPVKDKTDELRKAINWDPLYSICLNRYTEVYGERILKMDKPASKTKANDSATAAAKQQNK
jgi:hypothetical protein